MDAGWSCILQYFLISDAWTFIRHINPAAFLKSVCCKKMLHSIVFLVGIDADICCFGFTECKAAAENSFFFTAPGDTVDGSV